MKKRILFVYPSSYDQQRQVIRRRKAFFPSRALPYLAALTPPRFEMRIVDELVDEVNFDEPADLVVLTGMLRHMPRAMDIAHEFRARGETTIIGGVGAYAIRDQVQASGHFGSFVIGEVEGLWEEILCDFERGELKQQYQRSCSPELTGLPPARFDLLNTKKYKRSLWDLKHPILPIETSRGCPHNCDYCLVSRYFGRKMRYRPIGEVVEEVKHHGCKFLFFTDDNIGVNPVRAKELFRALKPLKIHWLGQFESSVIRDPEVLHLARECGCDGALVGVESLVPENRSNIDKFRHNSPSLKELVKAFDDADIALIASMIFGLDHDTPDLIDWSIEELLGHGVDCLIPWILTPTPGTPCYDHYKAEQRLVHENYSLYDNWHAVIKPNLMSAQELEAAFWRGLKRFYSIPQILRRQWPPYLDSVPGALYHFYFWERIREGWHPLS